MIYFTQTDSTRVVAGSKSACVDLDLETVKTQKMADSLSYEVSCIAIAQPGCQDSVWIM